jgi:hypothetical protein
MGKRMMKIHKWQGIGYIVRGEEHGLTRVVQVMLKLYGS